MPHYRYLIIGGGMTGDAAVRGIRKVDKSGPIGLIGKESHPPYNRPPLTKGLWKGQSEETIWRGTQEFDVNLQLGRTAKTLDTTGKRVTDDQGTAYTFDRLLLATGGIPRRLPFGGDHILYYRSFDDYQRLRADTERGERFAVIGGGFIGSEIAAALAMNGKQVVMLFPVEGIGAKMFPPSLARSLNDYYREKGVEVLAGESVSGLETKGDRKVVVAESGRRTPVDGVVAGIGIQPNTDLAHSAGVKVDDGIVVDELLRTNRAEIYAAGDVAQFYNPALDKHLRVEHEDNANDMGTAAGKNMAGAEEPYHHLPFFYSDLFDLGYEAVGDLDSRLQTVEDWKEPYREGVVYYLKEGRVRGVLLWNVWEQVDNARKLIAEPGPFTAKHLKGRLPA